MTLLDEAAADLQAIITDPAGFSVPVTVTSPSGQSAKLRGLQADIGLTIDPDTGQAVVGSKVSIALSIKALQAAGLGIPKAIADGEKQPWLVSFATPTSAAAKFKVAEAVPDRLGCVVCFLEVWKD